MERPLVFLVGSFATGIWLGNILPWPVEVLLFLGIAFVTFAYLGYRNGWRGVMALVLVAMTLAGVLWGRLAVAENSLLVPYVGKQVQVEGQVVSEARVYEKRVVYDFRVRQLRAENITFPLKEKVQLIIYLGEGPAEIYHYGDVLEVRGNLSLPPEARNPGEFSYRSYLRRHGIYTQLKVYGSNGVRWKGNRVGNPLIWEALKAKGRVVTFLTEHLPPQQARILRAVLFGDKEVLEDGEQERFLRAGVMHIFAVSGLHVGFLVALVLGVSGALRLNRGTTLGLVFLACLFYGALTGFAPSVVRASIMAVVGVAAYYFGRERDFYSSLALAAFILLIYNPLLLYDPGFQLSFIATWGIVYFYPLVDGMLVWFPSWRRWLVVPIAAQLAVLPLSGYYFNTVSLVGLAANLVAASLVGIIVNLGLVVFILVFLFPFLAEVLAYSAGALAELLETTVNFLSEIPGAALKVATPEPWSVAAYFILLVAGREIWQHRHYEQFKRWWEENRQKVVTSIATLLLLSVMLLVLWETRPGSLQLVFLDVGQGDAIYIKTPSGKHILVDGGGSSSSMGFEVGEQIVVPFLVRQGIKKLDLVVNTHPHRDHLEGLLAVAREFPISLVVMPPVEPNEELEEFLTLLNSREIRYNFVRRGDRIEIDPLLTIEVLHPSHRPEEFRENLNNYSLVLKISYGDKSVLLTGDIEQEAMVEMLQRQVDVEADIFKVSHHGSRFSLHKEFLERVSPEVAVISVGRNVFGHPSPEILDYWRERQVPVFRTDLHGAVIIDVDRRNWKVRTMLPHSETVAWFSSR
ncbi:DNA internalization-related competence protein ComEC/Rec2 [Calderihabitans maritimus]|uniref:DNA internalization-related competence protein ComEC/Rec2 n=1 Tax=Calderihabitans maritimus TaxID=1246530 RepID=A0A1Z5HVC2_9FIRM|nr:DNA internalization-related competence protein ComEC/Rec2 [Calderihabitans maritimus]GAW93464.1 DNA internalization-related competence protein ComEC/Rec2 [Calderihabitans maritimus]